MDDGRWTMSFKVQGSTFKDDGRWTTSMIIRDLTAGDTRLIEQVAAILVEGFREHWPDAWPDMESALGEAREPVGEARRRREGGDGEGTVLGCVRAMSESDGE